MAQKYVAYVGSYTYYGSSKGISIMDVDVEKGIFTKRKEVSVNNSSYLVASRNNKYLYSVVDEGVAAFKILPDGDLEYLNTASIRGMRTCYLTVDKAGKFLVTAGYHDGKMTILNINEDGSVGSIASEIFDHGTGTIGERNFRPHVNCVRPTPDNKYLCAVDNGIDQIKIYRINKRRHKLELVDILRCPRESGPRIIRFSSDGKYAYILFELSNEIKVYSYDGSGENPEFELLQSVSTLSKKHDKDAIHNAASGLALAPDGKHLFCTTAGENTVSMYEVDAETGLLEKKFTLPISGDYPKDLVIFPDNQHIAVANHASNTITTFKVDYDKNIIVMNDKPHNV